MPRRYQWWDRDHHHRDRHQCRQCRVRPLRAARIGDARDSERRNVSGVDRRPATSLPTERSRRTERRAGPQCRLTGTNPNPEYATGRLRVLPGGTLNSVTLTLGGTVGSLITTRRDRRRNRDGEYRRRHLGRTMRFIGTERISRPAARAPASPSSRPASLFPKSPGQPTLPLKTTGIAILGGTVQHDFNGVTPTLGQSWDIIDAASVNGAFATMLPIAVPLPGRWARSWPCAPSMAA